MRINVLSIFYAVAIVLIAQLKAVAGQVDWTWKMPSITHEAEDANGVTLVGGSTCAAANAAGLANCTDHWTGALGGRWEMFWNGQYMTLKGKGYFMLRWEWGWFNYPRSGQFVMPTFTNRKGVLKQVAGSQLRGDDVTLSPSTPYGGSHLGVVVNNNGSNQFEYTWFPNVRNAPWATRQHWLNEYFYLDGQATFRQNEGYADYNVSITPVSYADVVKDVNVVPLSSTWSVRPGVSFDPAPAALPTRPKELKAALVGTDVNLSWQACTGDTVGTLIEYSDGALYSDGKTMLYRLAASVPGAINSWVVGLLKPGNTYALRLKCYNSLGDSAYSNVVTVVVPPANSLSKGWYARDIGINPIAATSSANFGYAGSVSQYGSQFQVGGSGSDIWGTADHFRYVFRSLNGDGQITARITGVQYHSPASKAGLMIRATTSPSSAYVNLFTTPYYGSSLEYRSASGAVAASATGYLSGQRAPYWFRLVRAGNVFTSYTSPDNVSWTLFGSQTVTMPSKVLVGLAVTAHTTYTSLGTQTIYNDLDGLNRSSFTDVAVVGH